MERLGKKTALDLLKGADLLGLGGMADELRKHLHPEGVVTFVVDRNINYTNVCVNRCRFCAFYREPDSPEAYVLGRDELFSKIDETIALGGTQILLQGGLHPDLGLDFYTGLLRAIKERYSINVHGFSPPEIWHLAERHHLTIRETLCALREAGLDSIPGGGAEILSDRVRKTISPRKIRSSAWLRVMEEAHRIGMRTTATMMFGSVESLKDIVEHLAVIRDLQDRTGGFTAFIPWSFQPGNTDLGRESGVESRESSEKTRFSREAGKEQSTRRAERAHLSAGFKAATAVDYLRVLAVSRLFLDNIANVQASWVTQGLKLAQVALRFGANDFGSTMIEENVVRAAGVSYRVSMDDIVTAIRAAGFSPAQRDTYYTILREF